MAEISIIVPVYKVEPYLHCCIDSILLQTFADFNLILIDDGSPDNCGAICDEYATLDHRITVIHQPNKGLSAARNAGIDYVMATANSNWITFVDSDDYIHAEYLEQLYNAAKLNMSEYAAIGYMTIAQDCFEPNNHHYRTQIVTVKPDEFFGRVYTFDHIKIPINIAWGKLYKKELLADIRFPFGKTNEDRFVAHEIAFQCDHIAVIPQPLYHYRIRENSIMRSAWSAKELDDIDAIRCQLHFFKIHNAPLSHTVAVHDYFRVVLRQLQRIQASKSKINNCHKIQVKKELIRCLFKYSKTLNLSQQEKLYVLFSLFPQIKHLVKKLQKLG